jgi:hypothetical protein
LHEEIPLLVSELIDRTLNDWLYPAGDEHPTFDTLGTALDDQASTLTVVLNGRLETLARDSVIEIDAELMKVSSTSGSTVTLLQRGWGGTTVAAHAEDATVWADPLFTRIEVFRAVRSLIGLFRSWGLYVRDTNTDTLTLLSTMDMPAGWLEVLNIIVKQPTSDELYYPLRMKGIDWVEYREFDPIKVKVNRGYEDAEVTFVGKKGFTLPDAEADDLDTEIHEALQEAMPMAVAGMVLKPRELPRAYVDRLRELLASESVQVGQIVNIGDAMLSTFRRDAVYAERARLRELDPPSFEFQRR